MVRSASDRYKPLHTADGKVGAVVTVSSEVLGTAVVGDKIHTELELTVRSNIYKPIPGTTFSQALLGIQLLSPGPDAELLDYEPKYVSPTGSYTISTKSASTRADTASTQSSQSSTSGLTTNLALSKSTIFSVGTSKVRSYSYLEGCAATDTVSTEEGVSVTQNDQQAWQVLDLRDTLHVWNSKDGAITTSENPGGACWTVRLLHGDLLQDACATGQLTQTITLTLSLQKCTPNWNYHVTKDLELQFHVFHQYASTFKPPEMLQTYSQEVMEEVDTVAKNARNKGTNSEALLQSTDRISTLLAHKGRDDVFGCYVWHFMWGEALSQCHTVSPAALVGVTIKTTSRGTAELDKLAIQEQSHYPQAFDGLAAVGTKQELGFTQNPRALLAQRVNDVVNRVESLANALDESCHRVAPEFQDFHHRFCINKPQYYLGRLQQVVANFKANCPILQSEE